MLKRQTGAVRYILSSLGTFLESEDITLGERYVEFVPRQMIYDWFYDNDIVFKMIKIVPFQLPIEITEYDIFHKYKWIEFKNTEDEVAFKLRWL